MKNITKKQTEIPVNKKVAEANRKATESLFNNLSVLKIAFKCRGNSNNNN